MILREAAGSAWSWMHSRRPGRIRRRTCRPARPLFQFADDGAFSRLLAGRGARGRDRRSSRVPGSSFESADELWTGLIDGSVRVLLLVAGQPPEMQRAIRTHFDQLVEEYRTEEGFEVPVAVKLASGSSPPSAGAGRGGVVPPGS